MKNELRIAEHLVRTHLPNRFQFEVRPDANDDDEIDVLVYGVDEKSYSEVRKAVTKARKVSKSTGGPSLSLIVMKRALIVTDQCTEASLHNAEECIESATTHDSLVFMTCSVEWADRFSGSPDDLQFSCVA